MNQESLLELLRYEPETGRLFWRERALKHFGGTNPEQAMRLWNAKWAGKEALNCNDDNGYRVGAVFSKPVKAHRAIWCMVHGHWPKIVDHIDGNPENNRIENLRNVSYAESAKNLGTRTDNKSGVVGVSWVSSRKKWLADIRADGKTICLGRYSLFDDAVAARAAANLKYGFHENHGKRPASMEANR